MNNINLKMNLNQFSKSWAVYGLFDVNTNQAIYVGCIKLANLFTLSDARSNIEFRPTDELLVILIDTYDNRSDAIIEQSRKLRELNIQIIPRTHGKAVRCISTGETFESLTAVSDAHGLTYSALCNHLSRKPGFVTVKGKVYERIDKIKHFEATGQIRNVPPPPRAYNK